MHNILIWRYSSMDPAVEYNIKKEKLDFNLLQKDKKLIPIVIEFSIMHVFFVLIVLLSFLGRACSVNSAPVVSTLYSGPISPAGLWSDANGNIYGCETGFHSVFKIASGGVKTDFAGTRGTAGVASEGVLALNALFHSPRAVWGDGKFLYVTDSVNNRIRRISWATSLVTTIVGGGIGSILTSGSFPGTSVALTLPNCRIIQWEDLFC
jgi:hypothetical protein